LAVSASKRGECFAHDSTLSFASVSLKHTVLCYVLSSVALAAFLYFSPFSDGHSSPAQGYRVVSLYLGAFMTAFYWGLYLLADHVRRRRRWSPWSL